MIGIFKVVIIGAGFAGCECAYQLLKRGVDVEIVDIKPQKFTPAHSNPNFCEVVCSNSLKSKDILTASGLLKAEMECFDSLILNTAKKCAVPAGNALAVDREKFASLITEKLKEFKNLKIICNEATEICNDGITVIATGPLTTGSLATAIQKITGTGHLHFFDASAPIVDFDSLNKNKCFVADRYNKGNGDYINCPLNKAEYEMFYNELINAKTVELKDFENKAVFEGCMPIETLARRGFDTLRFGPLKPIGITNPLTNEKYYAVVQLRKENSEGSLFNLVGFQTNLLFSEQKRVFSLIPALKDANFVKYGVMHRNSYIDAPKVLNKYFQLKDNQNVFIAGQLSGVEGYIESAMSGLLCGINCFLKLKNENMINLSQNTLIGAIINYITTSCLKNFQPMNANYGIITPLEKRISDEKIKKQKIYERAIDEVSREAERIKNIL